MSARPLGSPIGTSGGTSGSVPPAYEARVAAEERKSLPTLLRELVDDGRRLLRDELRLARAETRENLQSAARSLTAVGIGIALGLAAVLALAAALNQGLTVLLAEAVGPEVAVWLSPLVLAVVFGLVAWALVRKGLAGLSPRQLVPDQTLQTLREEKEWLRRASH